MRTRSSILVAAVTAALLAGGVSPAVALSEPSAAATAVAGRMLVAPRAEALVTRLPVRVAVRVPARTSRLRVRVGGRDVRARFRPHSGSLRVANLTRRQGLRYGPNHLLVLAQRRGRRPVAEARSFVLARRQNGLVRLRLRRGPVTSLGVQVTGAPGLAPEHFRQPGEVERRLSVIRRVRTGSRLAQWQTGHRRPRQGATDALDGVVVGEPRAALWRQPAADTGRRARSRPLRAAAPPLRGAPKRPSRGGGMGHRHPCRRAGAPRRPPLTRSPRRARSPQLEDSLEAERLARQAPPCRLGAAPAHPRPPGPLRRWPDGQGPYQARDGVAGRSLEHGQRDADGRSRLAAGGLQGPHRQERSTRDPGGRPVLRQPEPRRELDAVADAGPRDPPPVRRPLAAMRAQHHNRKQLARRLVGWPQWAEHARGRALQSRSRAPQLPREPRPARDPVVPARRSRSPGSDRPDRCLQQHAESHRRGAHRLGRPPKPKQAGHSRRPEGRGRQRVVYARRRPPRPPHRLADARCDRHTKPGQALPLSARARDLRHVVEPYVGVEHDVDPRRPGDRFPPGPASRAASTSSSSTRSTSGS